MSYFLWPHGLQAPGSSVLHSLPEFSRIHVHWVSDAIQTFYPVTLFSFYLQSFPALGPFSFFLLFIYLFILFVVNFVIHWNETAMGLHVFPIPNESALLIRWPKYWTFSFSINPSDGYSGLISFRIDWFYLLAVQGTLRSLLPHYSLKASILQHSAFFMLQLSYLYMINGKTIALTIWSSVF